MLEKTITLDHLLYKGIQQIRIDFKFDSKLNELAKSLPARWSYSNKCWYLENTQENIQKIFAAFKGKAWVDITKLNERKELFPKTILQKSRAAQFNMSKLSPGLQEKTGDFKMYLTGIRYSERTIDNYMDMLCSFLGYNSEKAVEEITNADVEKFNYEFIIKNQYSASYQRQLVSVLKLFFGRMPGSKLEIGKLERPQRSFRLPTVLSETEVIRILKSIPNLKHKAIISCIYSSGLRISELLNLQLKDIDTHRMQIRIVKGKGDKDRVVGLSKMFLLVLQHYVADYSPKDYVFNGEHGGRYSETSVRNILRAACNKAGIRKKVTPHTLRHSYATHMLENGVDIRYIQELLGHSRPETTMIYAHVAQKKLVNIKSPLDLIVEKGENKEENELYALKGGSDNPPLPLRLSGEKPR
jgi:site-specific recombinase XerD